MTALPRPTAILLDWDGTINDSMGLLCAAYNAVLAHFGRPPITVEQARSFTVHEARRSMDELLGGSPTDADHAEGFRVFYAFVKAHNTDYLARLPDGSYRGLIPGALAFLERAVALNIPMCIVSNKNGDLLRQDIDRLGWTARFGAVLGANEAARNKPSGDPALAALRRLDVAPGKAVWFIGDTSGDMACAADAGLTGITIAEGQAVVWACDLLTSFESLTDQL